MCVSVCLCDTLSFWVSACPKIALVLKLCSLCFRVEKYVKKRVGGEKNLTFQNIMTFSVWDFMPSSSFHLFGFIQSGCAVVCRINSTLSSFNAFFLFSSKWGRGRGGESLSLRVCLANGRSLAWKQDSFYSLPSHFFLPNYTERKISSHFKIDNLRNLILKNLKARVKEFYIYNSNCTSKTNFPMRY